MESNDGGLGFKVSLDNSQLAADAARIKAQFSSIGDAGVAQGARIENSFNRMTTAAGAYLSLRFASQIGGEIIQVRGEFQQLGIAFETMLGSKEKADEMMRKSIQLAARSPFTLSEVAGNAKQLMAMGVGAESVLKTLKDIGDVASGVSVPISRLAINYGQVMTLGRLQEREVRDFAMAGVPLVDQLAKNLGKTKAEIQGMISASQIGADEVTKAFQTMAGEGGKFYNMMEKQNASVTGQISNLKDKLQIAANELGQANEGVIYGGISLATSAIANYKEIGDTVTGLAITYGAYKAAVMLVSASQETELAVIAAKKGALTEQWAIEKETQLTMTARAEKEAAISAKSATNEQLKQAAMAKTVAAMEASEIAAAELAAAEERLAHVQGKRISVTAEVAAVERARANYQKTIVVEQKALTTETIVNSRIEAQAVTEANAQKMISEEAGIALKQKEVLANTVATGAEIRAAQAKKLSAAAQQLLNATMLNNPWVAGAVALGAIAYGTYKYLTYQTELEKATSKMNVELENEKDKVNDLFSALKLTTEGTKEHESAKKRLIDQYGQFIPEQNKELKNLGDIKTAYDEVNKSITEHIALKARDEMRSSTSDEYNKKSVKGKNNLIDQFEGQAKSDVSFIISDLINKFKIDGTSASQVESEWLAFYKKLADIDKNAVTGIKARRIQDYFAQTLLPIGEMNDELKNIDTSFNKFISDSKKGQAEPTAPILPTVKKQIEDTQKAIKDAEAELKKMRAPDSVKTPDEIESQEKTIKSLKEKEEFLTGVKAKEAKKQLKTQEEKLDALRDLAQKELEIMQILEESKTAAIESGSRKQMKAIEDSYRNQLISIAKQEKDYLETLNKSEGFESTNPKYIKTLPENVQDEFDQMKVNARQSMNNAIFRLDEELANKQNAIWDSSTEAFISNVEKEKRAVNKKYDDLIAQQRELAKTKNVNYTDADGNVQSTSVLDTTAIDELNKQRAKELQKINQETALKLSPLYQKAFGDIEKYGTKTLENLKKQMDDLLNSAKQVDVDGKTMIQVSMPNFDSNGKKISDFTNMSIEEFTQWKNKLNDITNKVEANNPFLAVAKSGKAMFAAFKSGNDKDISDSVKAITNNAKEAAATVKEWGDSISTIFEDDSGIGKAAKKVAEVAQGTVDLGSGVAKLMSGDIIGGVTDTLKGIAELTTAFSKNHELSAEQIRQYESLVNVIGQVIDKQMELLSSLSGTDAVEVSKEILDNIQKSVDAARSMGHDYLESRKARDHSYGYQLRENLKPYIGDINALGVAWDGEAGSFMDLSAKQLEVIKTKLPEAWAQLDDQTQGYLQTIIDGTSDIEKMKDALNEALTNLSFDSAKSELQDLLLSVDTTMSDVADNFEDYMRKAIVNMISNNDLLPALTKWYQDFSDAMADGILTEAERAALQAEYTNIYSLGKTKTDAAYSVAGIDPNSGTSTRTGSSKGIAQASQDSVDELNGRFTAIQGHTFSMSQGVGILVSNSERALKHLAGIETNTARLENIENSMTSVKDRMNDMHFLMTTSGIKIK